MADEFTKAALYWIKTFNKKVKEKIWTELEKLRKENEKLRYELDLKNAKEENRRLKLMKKWYTIFFSTDDGYYTDKWFIFND